MRSIENLLKEQEHVWFYVAERWQKEFYEELISLGMRFMSGDNITQESIGVLMGISNDGTVGYVSHFIWYNSFFSSSSTPAKVDYEKYRCEKEDYLITKPNITPVNWNDVEVIE